MESPSVSVADVASTARQLGAAANLASAALADKKGKRRSPPADPAKDRLRRAHARAAAALAEVHAALQAYQRAVDPTAAGGDDSPLGAPGGFSSPSPSGARYATMTPMHAISQHLSPASPTSPATPDFSEKLSDHTLATLQLETLKGVVGAQRASRKQHSPPAAATPHAGDEENVPAMANAGTPASMASSLSSRTPGSNTSRSSPFAAILGEAPSADKALRRRETGTGRKPPRRGSSDRRGDVDPGVVLGSERRTQSLVSSDSDMVLNFTPTQLNLSVAGSAVLTPYHQKVRDIMSGRRSSASGSGRSVLSEIHEGGSANSYRSQSRYSDPPTPGLRAAMSTVKMRRLSASTASSASSTDSPAPKWASPPKTPMVRRGDRPFDIAEELEEAYTESAITASAHAGELGVHATPGTEESFQDDAVDLASACIASALVNHDEETDDEGAVAEIAEGGDLGRVQSVASGDVDEKEPRGVGTGDLEAAEELAEEATPPVPAPLILEVSEAEYAAAPKFIRQQVTRNDINTAIRRICDHIAASGENRHRVYSRDELLDIIGGGKQRQQLLSIAFLRRMVKGASELYTVNSATCSP